MSRYGYELDKNKHILDSLKERGASCYRDCFVSDGKLMSYKNIIHIDLAQPIVLVYSGVLDTAVTRTHIKLSPEFHQVLVHNY